jgi:hypothetical protein
LWSFGMRLMNAKQGVTISFTKEEIDAFWAFQERIYDSLGSAADDVIEICAEGADYELDPDGSFDGAADSFFEKLKKASNG